MCSQHPMQRHSACFNRPIEHWTLTVPSNTEHLSSHRTLNTYRPTEHWTLIIISNTDLQQNWSATFLPKKRTLAAAHISKCIYVNNLKQYSSIFVMKWIAISSMHIIYNFCKYIYFRIQNMNSWIFNRSLPILVKMPFLRSSTIVVQNIITTFRMWVRRNRKVSIHILPPRYQPLRTLTFWNSILASVECGYFSASKSSQARQNPDQSIAEELPGIGFT